MSGTLAGCDSWFRNGLSGVSAHYGVGLDGTIHQYVHLQDMAWANGILEPGNTWPGTFGVNPNLLTVSIETEDLANPQQPVSEAQYLACLQVGRLAIQTYPSIRYLLTHRVISPQSRPNCPGARWVASGRFTQLANTLSLLWMTG